MKGRDLSDARGFTFNVLHGSPNRNLHAVSSAPPSRQYDNATSALGAFFTTNENEAARYAGPSGRIYNASVRLAKPYEMSWGDFAYYQDVTRSRERLVVPPSGWSARLADLVGEARDLRARLEREGCDGIVVRRGRGEIEELVSFKDVRVE